MQHAEITGEQAAALARLVYNSLGQGSGGKRGGRHTDPRRLHSWSKLILNVADDTGVLHVQTPLGEEPFVRFEIKPNGMTVIWNAA